MTIIANLYQCFLCLVFTHASPVLISSVSHYGQTTAGFSESTCLHMASASSLLASLHRNSLWSKRTGGYEHSWFVKDSCLAPSVLVDVATLRRWNSNRGLTDTFWWHQEYVLSVSDYLIHHIFKYPIPVDWTSSTVTEVDATTPVTMQWRVVSGEKRLHVVKKFNNLSTSCLPWVIYGNSRPGMASVMLVRREETDWGEFLSFWWLTVLSTSGFIQKSAELLCLTSFPSIGWATILLREDISTCSTTWTVAMPDQWLYLSLITYVLASLHQCYGSSFICIISTRVSDMTLADWWYPAMVWLQTFLYLSFSFSTDDMAGMSFGIDFLFLRLSIYTDSRYDLERNIGHHASETHLSYQWWVIGIVWRHLKLTSHQICLWMFCRFQTWLSLNYHLVSLHFNPKTCCHSWAAAQYVLGSSSVLCESFLFGIVSWWWSWERNRFHLTHFPTRIFKVIIPMFRISHIVMGWVNDYLCDVI